MDNTNEIQQAQAHLDTCKPAHQRYDQEIARIDKQYDQAVAPALAHYNQIKSAAWEAYTQAKKRATSEEEIKAAFDVYDQTTKQVWKNFLRETNRARSEQLRAHAQAREDFEQEIAKITQTFFGEEGR